MSSLFDLAVYQRRQHTPWSRMSLKDFIKEMAWSGPVKLTAEIRHEVSTRFWFTLEWTDETGTPCSASAQELDLCLWRAAEIELSARQNKMRPNN